MGEDYNIELILTATILNFEYLPSKNGSHGKKINFFLFSKAVNFNFQINVELKKIMSIQI